MVCYRFALPVYDALPIKSLYVVVDCAGVLFLRALLLSRGRNLWCFSRAVIVYDSGVLGGGAAVCAVGLFDDGADIAVPLSVAGRRSRKTGVGVFNRDTLFTVVDRDV